MNQRGRKSAAQLAVVGADIPGISRIPPPAGLTEAERQVWLATVNSRPAEWFGTEHVPLLVSYVRHTVSADILNQQIEAFDPEWLKTDDGLKRYKTLLKLRGDETKMINTFARAMRMTQQSLYRHDKSTRKGMSGSRPWE